MTQYTHTVMLKIIGISLLLMMSACGDGSFQQANGIGGTGITMGRISNFGSLYVNGIKYNTDNARFSREGIDSKMQSDFSTGEMVKIIGKINADNTTGVASEVIFSHLLEGSVSRIANDKTLQVLGQKVTTNDLTVLHGFTVLSDLKLDNIVEVSGFIDSQGNITASSLKLIQTQFTQGSVLDIEGTISQLNTEAKTFVINNNLTIDYAAANFTGIAEAGLVNGLYLNVGTEQNLTNGIFFASTVDFIEESLVSGISYEIEGAISRYVSATDFDVDGIAASTNTQTVFKTGTTAALKRDAWVIIKGVSNTQGKIIIEEISLPDAITHILIEAKIETIDYAASRLSLLGKSIHIDNSTLMSDETSNDLNALLLNQFSQGESVFISVYRNNEGRYIASRLSKIDTITAYYLSAIANTVDSKTGTLSLFDQTIVTNNETLYLNANDDFISKQAFYDVIEAGKTEIDVLGEIAADGALVVTILGIVPE